LKWAVLRTAPHRESNAAANAENKLNLESYAPRCKELSQVKPLFPGYSFVRTEINTWGKLLRLRHVRGILMAGDHPSWLPDRIVQELRSQEESTGLISCSPRFTFRQKLAITGSPFTCGLYLGLSPGNRVRLLFELLGQEFEAEVHLKQVLQA
jgi:transcription antitermination factor NusG